MSLYERFDLPRKLVRISLALGFCFGLAGCFQPLYGSLGGHLNEELQAVAVDPIPDRIGHYLGNELIFALNGTGSEVVPKYRLIVTVSQSVAAPLVDSFSSRASAATVSVQAYYRLVPAGGGAVIAQGVATSLSSYDRTAQRFANLRAARDAEIRNAKTLADQIRLRVSTALATKN